MRPGRDSDSLLFLGQTDERHLVVILGHANEVYQPGLRQRRYDAHAALLEAVVDQLGAGYRDGHSPNLRRLELHGSGNSSRRGFERRNADCRGNGVTKGKEWGFVVVLNRRSGCFEWPAERLS